jgi:hypothetical protein
MAAMMTATYAPTTTPCGREQLRPLGKAVPPAALMLSYQAQQTRAPEHRRISTRKTIAQKIPFCAHPTNGPKGPIPVQIGGSVRLTVGEG